MIINDIINSVKFLFAKPYSEGYYVYSIDDLDSLILIEKSELKEILYKLNCRDFQKINYIMDRNFPLFFDAEKKKIVEFEKFNDSVNETVKNEILENLKIKPKNTSVYENFFGKNSNVYKLNFYEVMNYGNSKSI